MYQGQLFHITVIPRESAAQYKEKNHIAVIWRDLAIWHYSVTCFTFLSKHCRFFDSNLALGHIAISVTFRLILPWSCSGQMSQWSAPFCALKQLVCSHTITTESRMFLFFFFLLHATFTRLKGGIIHRSLQNFSLFHPLVSKERATSGALCKVVSHSPQQRKTCASVFIISQTHLLAAQCCSSYWYHYS